MDSGFGESGCTVSGSTLSQLGVRVHDFSPRAGQRTKLEFLNSGFLDVSGFRVSGFKDLQGLRVSGFRGSVYKASVEFLDVSGFSGVALLNSSNSSSSRALTVAIAAAAAVAAVAVAVTVAVGGVEGVASSRSHSCRSP